MVSYRACRVDWIGYLWYYTEDAYVSWSRVFGDGLLKRVREVDTLRARLEYVKIVGLSSKCDNTMGWNID